MKVNFKGKTLCMATTFLRTHPNSISCSLFQFWKERSKRIIENQFKLKRTVTKVKVSSQIYLARLNAVIKNSIISPISATKNNN